VRVVRVCIGTVRDGSCSTFALESMGGRRSGRLSRLLFLRLSNAGRIFVTAGRAARSLFDAKAGEFLLPYSVVRNAPDPEQLLSSFLDSTYDAAARLADWDRKSLECPRGLIGLPRDVLRP
jgi:Family of unknown function (DUF5996)